MESFKLFFMTCAFLCACSPNDNNIQKNVIKTEDGLKCEKSRFYFGDVSSKDNNITKFTFKIKNTKNILIDITSVDVDCECIHVESYPKRIKPNVAANIVGYVDLRKQHGHISKPIFVNTANKKTLLLRVVGNVTP